MKNRNQISQTQRIARSRHTGEWILEELNTVYGYYATIRRQKDMTQAEIDGYLQMPTYDGPKHPAQERYDSCTLCG